MPELVVSGIHKRFGNAEALRGVSFTVADGELFTLLGPSGCGKTTTLQSIAGFVSPDQGTITCGDEVFVDAQKAEIPAESRNLGIVFQSYALWPSMRVRDNVEFPLRIRKVPASARRQQAAEILELVELSKYAERYPHELSGGQRQRVALARALVYRPSVLLLDEPFSNLDAKLRERAREWLRELQQQLQITTVFVTHDQEEALSMSDRVLVMRDGQVLRSGTAEDIYADPRDRFVAEFIGQCNFLSGSVERDGGELWLRPAALADRVRLTGATESVNGRATAAVRPEDIEIRERSGVDAGWTLGEICGHKYLGAHILYAVNTGHGTLAVRTPERFSGHEVELRVRDGSASVVIESQSEQEVGP